MAKSKPVFAIDLYRSYLSTILGSPGSRMYRHLWCHDNGKPKDILRGGQLSCAQFVAAVLYQYKLIADMHSTVEGTLKDMKETGWQKISKPRSGAVISWAPKLYENGELHSHLGFVVDSKTAISNSATRRIPVRHHITYGPRPSQNYRKIAGIWWHPKLNG